jgi:hypothetical protein
VVVETTADLVAGEEIGKLIFFRSGDFSTVFAKFGRNEGQAQSFVELFFVFELEGGFGLSLEKAPLTEMEASIDGSLAKSDVMFF